MFDKYNIILASLSPRRRHLLAEMGISFEARVSDSEETYPETMSADEVAIFLSKKKSDFFSQDKMADNDIIITADTLVSLHGKIIPKPADEAEACEFLRLLSGNMHLVYTGVTIKDKTRTHSFLSESKVWFRKLSEDDICRYVKTFKPLDKAGAYGIQEWIGYVGIERIEGSFFNVMGLPTAQLYAELKKFIGDHV
jgi:septum formation protein